MPRQQGERSGACLAGEDRALGEPPLVAHQAHAEEALPEERLGLSEGHRERAV